MENLKTIWAKFLTLKLWQKAIVVLLAYVLFSAVTGFGSSSDSPESSSSSSAEVQRSYPVKYLRHAVINPATISVAFQVKNDGTQPIRPSCKIKMQDVSGTYKGYDFVDFLEDIAPNQSREAVVQLTVTKEGAAFADQFIGECSATTSDIGTNAGKEVVVSDIEDASWGDDQYELDQNKEFPEDAGFWYGPTFKVNQPRMTQMDCTWSAFDKSGRVVGTHSFRANTLNDGSVTSYGAGEKWYVDSTQRIVNTVESYDVKCTL
jgi:FlaG/FlaF family flagellin (archaellin)